MKIQGKCHICGQNKKLTFEHIPPEKANNNKGVHVIQGDVLMNTIGNTRMPWDFSGLRYKNMQRGMGDYTLCENCNNDTGAWYAEDYIKFVNAIRYVLTCKINIEKTEAIKIELAKMFPLRIFKQVICMFASTMHPEFFDVHPDLREFVLNKESKNFDCNKYRVSMYLLKEPHNSWSRITCYVGRKS